MSCFHPLEAYRDRSSGRVTIGYHPGESPRRDGMELPCGRCVGCKMDRARAWSIRVMHEAQLYDSNLFVTLDYAPESLPKSLSLEYPHFQKFMRRLRRRMPGVSPSPVGTYPIRFFCAGEYGEKFQRPHWHAVLFNCYFKDSVRLFNGTSRSATAESVWEHGNVVIGEVTAASAAYVAGYTLAKRYGQSAQDHYEDVVNLSTGEVTARRAEFCQMSRDPGIGAWWYSRFKGDLFPKDHAVVEGKEHKVPGYYWRKFQQEADPLLVEELEAARVERARRVPLEESSDRRRCDREIVAKSRLKTFSERSH